MTSDNILDHKGSDRLIDSVLPSSNCCYDMHFFGNIENNSLLF